MTLSSLQIAYRQPELTAISLYKQRKNIAHATKPASSLTGLAADTSYVNGKASRQILRGARWGAGPTMPTPNLRIQTLQRQVFNKLFTFKGGKKREEHLSPRENTLHLFPCWSLNIGKAVVIETCLWA